MCTTIIVTKGAMADGSMVVTHSCDDELGDQRLIYIPEKNYEPGQLRPIFAEHYRYPRIVSKDRGPGYNTASYLETDPIGYIPQVTHTYAYFDGNYGIMNEHNLMIGECTNAANYQPAFVTENESINTGKHIRLFYSQELSRIALERCKTSRNAIKLMGELIDTYGLYSTGETLLVADKDEAWVFEMCALPNEKYHSAWVAKLIPDGEVFVAANEFRIRDILKDSDNFMYSKLLHPGIFELNWWKDSDGPIDWLKAVSPGEYNHPYYSLRRVWRIFDRVNPDLFLSPWVNDGYTKDYPFSIKPKNKLTLSDVFSLYRDHYEGTEFDLTKGVASGPYNDPNRFVGPYDGNQNNITKDKKYYGAWERAISIFYQGYTYACQIRPYAPESTKGLLWFAPDVSYTSCFVPFSSKSTRIPLSYQTGSPQKYDSNCAFWIFNFVGNWARLNYKQMTDHDILSLQRKLEIMSFDFIKSCDDKCRNTSHINAVEYITKACENNANVVLKSWLKLAAMLIAKYANGYCNLEDQSAPKDIGYSATWLSYTNYKDGPTSYDMNI